MYEIKTTQPIRLRRPDGTGAIFDGESEAELTEEEVTRLEAQGATVREIKRRGRKASAPEPTEAEKTAESEE